MKNEFKGTPGPWFCIAYSKQVSLQAQPRPSTDDLLHGLPKEVSVANGVLAAAAPDMLEALRETVIDLKILQGNMVYAAKRDSRWLDYDVTIQGWICRAEAAITKALDLTTADMELAS